MSKETEYILLKAMNENVLIRGFLLRVDFEVMKQIEDNRWSYKIPDVDKPAVRKYIQIDIISKIFMYSEDLVVLVKALRRGKEFYSEFLAPGADDLGDAIRLFFKGISEISNNDILKMMSLIDMSSIITDLNLAGSVKKIQSYINRVRSLLKELKDFGESNHIFIRDLSMVVCL